MYFQLHFIEDDSKSHTAVCDFEWERNCDVSNRGILKETNAKIEPS